MRKIRTMQVATQAKVRPTSAWPTLEALGGVHTAETPTKQLVTTFTNAIPAIVAGTALPGGIVHDGREGSLASCTSPACVCWARA